MSSRHNQIEFCESPVIFFARFRNFMLCRHILTYFLWWYCFKVLMYIFVLCKCFAMFTKFTCLIRIAFKWVKLPILFSFFAKKSHLSRIIYSPFFWRLNITYEMKPKIDYVIKWKLYRTIWRHSCKLLETFQEKCTNIGNHYGVIKKSLL